MPNTSPNFFIPIFFDDEVIILPEGQVISIEEKYPSEVYLPLECNNCKAVNLTAGEIEPTESHERSMGTENIHSSHHWVECSKCSQEIEAHVQFMEYPLGGLQPYQTEVITGCRVVSLPDLDIFVKSIKQTESVAQKNAAHAETIEWFIEQGYMSQAEGKLAKLLEARENVEKEHSKLVIVLGNYSKSLNTLEKVKDELECRGYLAALVKSFPDQRGRSVRDKSARLMGEARFCVMVDDVPSGHIAEYELARQNTVILARLIDQKSGSTSMIGEAEEVDLTHIKSFNIEDDLSSAIDNAISWAENQLKEREKKWRKTRDIF